MDEAAVRAALGHYLEHSAAGDEDTAHEIYHPDAVLDFPQSGERFEGTGTFLAWRRAYPATLTYHLHRLRGSGDVWVAEILLRYDEGPANLGVDILEFRGEKVARETIYVTQGWEAPEWRSPWWVEPPRRPGDDPASGADST